jgi:DNA-binding NarL/FixJ family response regulator
MGTKPAGAALTRREQSICRAVRAGRSNAEIAASFDISVQTVKNHLTTIFLKTGTRSRLQLALRMVDSDESSS